MKRKLISILTMSCLILAMMPTMVFAETEESNVWIPIFYSGDVTLANISGVAHRESTDEECGDSMLVVTEPGTIRFEVKSIDENYTLEDMKVYSGTIDFSLEAPCDHVTYSAMEKNFPVDSQTGTVTICLDVQVGKAYCIGFSPSEPSSECTIRIVDEKENTKQECEDLQSAINVVQENEYILINAEEILLDEPIVIDGKIVSMWQDHGVSIVASDAFAGESMIIVRNEGLLQGGELHLNGKNKVRYGIQTATGRYRPAVDIENCSFKNFTEYGIVADGADVYLKYCVTDGSNQKGSVHLVSGSNPGNLTMLATIGNEFKESTGIVYDDEKFSRYKPAEFFDMIFCDVAAPHTEGYDVWEKGADGIFVEKKTGNPSQPSDSDVRKAVLAGTNATGIAGEEVTVELQLTENSGIASMNVEMEYDKDILEFIAAENGEIFPLESFMPPSAVQSATDSSKILSWQNSLLKEDIKTTGKLATLKFRIKENASAGDTTVNFLCDADKKEAINTKGESVAVTSNASTISVMKFAYGDLDGNDKVDIADVLFLRRYIAKWKSYTIDVYAADLDKDGFVTLRDVTILERHIAGWAGYEKLPITVNPLPE